MLHQAPALTAPGHSAEGPEPPQERQFTADYDHSVQRYLLLAPMRFDPRVEHDLLIGFHGHGSDRRQYAAESRGECRGARDVAAKHDMIFISPDYRAPAAEDDLLTGIGRRLDMGNQAAQTLDRVLAPRGRRPTRRAANSIPEGGGLAVPRHAFRHRRPATAWASSIVRG
jgi:hypothetical protein